MRYLLFALPLLLLVALVAVFATSINRDPNLIRSVLIGRSVPFPGEFPDRGAGVPTVASG